MIQIKEQEKTSEITLNDTEIYELPHREFQITVIKMFGELSSKNK